MAVPAIVAILAAAICYWMSWVPSYSFDETVTLSLVDRTPWELLRTLEDIDAVHGLYYLFLQNWVSAFGADPSVTRLPSAIAIGLSAGGMAILGRLLISMQAGIIAAALLVVVPRANWAATEARPFPFTVLAAVGLSLVLVLALQRQQRRWWVIYSLVAAASTVLFIYSVFIFAAHAIVVLVTNHRRFLLFMIAAGAAVVFSSPVVCFALEQSSQVAWIKPLGPWTVPDVIEQQWFLGSAPAEWSTFILVGLGLLVGGVRWVIRRRSMAVPTAAPGPIRPGVFIISWLLVPLLGVLAVSTLIAPVYSPRYLTNTTPALALLLAWAIVSLSKSLWIRLVVLAVVVAAAVPAFVSNRAPYSKDSDYSQTAAWLLEKTHTGDAVLFARPGYPLSMRVVMYADKEAFAGVDDFMEKTSAVANRSYWPTEYPYSQVAARLGAHSRIWVVLASGSPFKETDMYATLSGLGYVVRDSIQGPFSGAVEMVRTG